MAISAIVASERVGCSYFVYAHLVNGKVIYVGAGGMFRPYDFATRNFLWKQAVYGAGLKNRDVEVICLSKHKLPKHAKEAEYKWIKFYNPPCNMRVPYIARHHRKRRGQKP